MISWTVQRCMNTIPIIECFLRGIDELTMLTMRWENSDSLLLLRTWFSRSWKDGSLPLYRHKKTSYAISYEQSNKAIVVQDVFEQRGVLITNVFKTAWNHTLQKHVNDLKLESYFCWHKNREWNITILRSSTRTFNWIRTYDSEQGQKKVIMNNNRNDKANHCLLSRKNLSFVVHISLSQDVWISW